MDITGEIGAMQSAPFIEATTTQGQKDSALDSRRKNDLRVAKIEADWKAKEDARRAALPSEDERKNAIIIGITRYEAKAKKAGEVEKAGKLGRYASDATDALTEYRALTKELSTPKPDPLGDATALAAKALVKALPSCFDSLEEARAFAVQYLPFGKARTEAVRVSDAYGKMSKARTKAGSRYWDAVTPAAMLATGLLDVPGSIKTMQESGGLI